MAMVNPMNPAISLNPNAKDSRWLTLEVCREYQRNKCTRTENECKFAHPPAHVEVQNGRVIACFDSIKGKCQRKDPPCKYLHPPQHLREQLLQNGRNNLILKSLQLQAFQHQVIPGIIPMAASVKSVPPAGGKPVAYPTAVLPGQIPYVVCQAKNPVPPRDSRQLIAPSHYDMTTYAASNGVYIQDAQVKAAAATSQSRPAHVSHPASFASPYLNTVPTSAVHQFNPYGIPTVAVPGAADGTVVTQQIPNVISTPITAAKAPTRPDRLEVCREFQRGTCTRQRNDCRYAHPTENVTVDCGDNQVTVCMDYVKNKCTRDSCRYFHPPAHLQSQIKAAQQRANAAPPSGSGPTHGVPQVVEVLTASKKRPRDPAEDLVLPQLGLVPPYKRVAMDSSGLGKSGIPVYQPTIPAGYHQAATLMQLQQQPYIPVTYSGEVMSPAYTNYLPQDPLVVAGAQPPGVGAAAAVVGTLTSPAAAASAAVGAPRKIPSNAYNVEYFDKNKQLLDTLPLCRDFRVGLCDRPTCRMVHVIEDVETTEDGRVVVCRDSVRNACKRALCKYYHIPVPLPPST